MRIKLIVIEEHTLGFLIPNSSYAGVLHSSVLKGSPISCPLSSSAPVLITDQKVRLAGKKDFDQFRVSFKGFDNKNEYEFAQ